MLAVALPTGCLFEQLLVRAKRRGKDRKHAL